VCSDNSLLTYEYSHFFSEVRAIGLVDYKAMFCRAGSIQLTATVRNVGQVPLNATTLVFPSGEVTSCSPPLGSGLPVGAASSCTLQYTVTQADIDAGTYSNSPIRLRANVSSGNYWSMPVQDSFQTTVQVQGTKVIAFDKAVLNTSYAEPGRAFF
jgi:hypothetical protein